MSMVPGLERLAVTALTWLSLSRCDTYRHIPTGMLEREREEILLSLSSWPNNVLSSKLSVSDSLAPTPPFLPPSPPHALVHATRTGRVLLYLRCFSSSTRFLSAFHGHPHVPWWSFLVSAPSINWRRHTPAHQDGSHSESRNPRPASVETLPVPCLQTHAILAIVFCRRFLFLMELDQYSRKPRTAIQNFCNKAHMSRRCWLVLSCISSPGNT